MSIILFQKTAAADLSEVRYRIDSDVLTAASETGIKVNWSQVDNTQSGNIDALNFSYLGNTIDFSAELPALENYGQVKLFFEGTAANDVYVFSNASDHQGFRVYSNLSAGSDVVIADTSADLTISLENTIKSFDNYSRERIDVNYDIGWDGTKYLIDVIHNGSIIGTTEVYGVVDDFDFYSDATAVLSDNDDQVEYLNGDVVLTTGDGADRIDFSFETAPQYGDRLYITDFDENDAIYLDYSTAAADPNLLNPLDSVTASELVSNPYYDWGNATYWNGNIYANPDKASSAIYFKTPLGFQHLKLEGLHLFEAVEVRPNVVKITSRTPSLEDVPVQFNLKPELYNNIRHHTSEIESLAEFVDWSFGGGGDPSYLKSVNTYNLNLEKSLYEKLSSDTNYLNSMNNVGRPKVEVDANGFTISAYNTDNETSTSNLLQLHASIEGFSIYNSSPDLAGLVNLFNDSHIDQGEVGGRFKEFNFKIDNQPLISLTHTENYLSLRYDNADDGMINEIRLDGNFSNDLNKVIPFIFDFVELDFNNPLELFGSQVFENLSSQATELFNLSGLSILQKGETEAIAKLSIDQGTLAINLGAYNLSLSLDFDSNWGDPETKLTELIELLSNVTIFDQATFYDFYSGAGEAKLTLSHDTKGKLFDASIKDISDIISLDFKAFGDGHKGKVDSNSYVINPAGEVALVFEGSQLYPDHVRSILSDLWKNEIGIYLRNENSISSSRKYAYFDGVESHYPTADVYAFATGNDEDLFLRAISLGDVTTYEVVATPNADIQSFGLTLASTSGLDISDFVVGTATATALGGVILPNVISANEVSVAAISTSGSLTGNQEHVIATFKTTGVGTLSITNGQIGTDGIPTLTYDISKATTNSSGSYNLTFDNGDAVQLQAQADYVVPSTNPITPSDALEVLKTVVRINQSPTPEQLIAGDTDKDGKLTPSDALSILKKVVRMDGGVEPEWVFIDGDKDYSSLSFTNVDYDNIIDIASIAADTTINFEGILLGDFDGTL